MMVVVREMCCGRGTDSVSLNSSNSPLPLEREGYGMGFPSHSIMELVWGPYTTLEWGTLKVC